ncbi:ensconsin isoform X13 [Culex quinquefasciatus]|uniref:ensconsin isoform X13 n=1 Tax=Culex quinquefasciatus TaxID=7176 RepID=UPI0018E3D8E8|nr:ensconsin isoform X13 [Culex quinquefasciatus]
MISVKRCAATNLSATPHHHHHQQQHHHHNGHHVPVQVRSLSAGRTAGKSNGTTVSGSTGSNNNNRLIRSRNSPYLGGGYSSGGSPGGGPAIIANGGSLYYSNSSVLGPTKSRSGLSEAGSDIYDELDSLFLVPKCALTYDKAMSLRKDLAAYDFNIRILEDTPRGNVWISGNRDASVQKQTRPSSANKDRHQRPHSVNHTLHWFACVGEDLDSATPATATNGYGNEDELQREREERIKQTKERQNEERQRKLEELKAQALAAQKFREQKEEERRRRMEDLRRRENDRRSQVEERRRAIQEAENERRQYILQKNQERDQRMDAKRRNERSSIQFAFGSSTPRMIETSDSGMCSSFWAHRRATSITNVAYTGAPLTRRSSERELTDGSSKKRATSASGLDRSTDGLRSGEITPNSLNTSRPGSAMSSSTTASGVVYRRSLPASAGSQRKPRPISIAVTGVSGLAKEEKPPLPKSSTGNTSSTSLERKRSQSGTSTPAKPAAPDTPARKHSSAERPHRVGGGSNSASARGTPKASSTPLQSPGPEKANRTLHDSLVKTGKKQASQEQLATPLPKEGSSVSAKSTDEKPAEVVEQKQEEQLTETVTTVESVVQEQQIIVTESKTEAEVVAEPEPVKEQPQLVEPDQVANSHEEKKDDMKDSTVAPPMPAAVTNLLDAQDGSNGDLMTASMIAKRITTEEEAKAALAERRRLAREEAERQAELERQRIAAEEEAEAQRQYEEEERLRKLEEESIRLAEEARRLEEERLQQAIEEATKREEEEKLRREEEARQKIEREESERKAREEAERQRIEMAERLKKEEKEREERRKRVEAIMSRTRAKGGSATNTPTKQSDEKDNAMSKSHIVMSSTPAVTADTTMSMTESMLGSVDQPQQQQSQEQDQAPSSGAESLEQAVQSLSLENNNNTNSNATSNGNHNNNNGDYERSVTEKENLLLGAFNNNGHDNNGSSAGSQQPSSLESSSTTPGATTNGKSTPGATTIAETTELIIEDAIMSGQTNGHKNGSIDNVFTQNPPTVDAKFLTHFDDTDELAPVLPPSDATDSLTNPLDAANDDLVVPPPTSQLIDFSSFQSLTAEQSEQPPQQPADDQDPFNLNINSINNNNNTNINNSSSVNPFDDDSSSLVVTGSTTSFSTNTTSLFTGSDANLISNSNFLNNNSTRLVATSDSQDNRDLSLL